MTARRSVTFSQKIGRPTENRLRGEPSQKRLSALRKILNQACVLVPLSVVFTSPALSFQAENVGAGGAADDGGVATNTAVGEGAGLNRQCG